MKKAISIKASSFMTDSNLYIPDSFANPTPPITGWRSAGSTCVLDGNGKRTGYSHVQTLEQYNLGSNAATGLTKPNVPSDLYYIPDYIDTFNCSPQNQPANQFKLTNTAGMSLNVNLKGRFNGYDYTYPSGVAFPLEVDLPPGDYQLLITGLATMGKRLKLSSTLFPNPVYGKTTVGVPTFTPSANFLVEIVDDPNPGNPDDQPF